MGIRDAVCYAISTRMIRPVEQRNASVENYSAWRAEALARAWEDFSDDDVAGKDMLDFGCGGGELSVYLARRAKRRRIVGVDLDESGIERARRLAEDSDIPDGVEMEFLVGSVAGMPVEDQSFDVVVAFDCVEHVMDPKPILEEWARVLRPGGKVLIEWCPYRGPWGPHMESLIPIPWGQYIFGQRAMFATCARIYEHPDFRQRVWDRDENGSKPNKPNKWKQWSTFKEQGYINELTIGQVRELAANAGFEVTRVADHGFSSAGFRRFVSNVMLAVPFVKEFFTSYYSLEFGLPRPADTQAGGLSRNDDG